MQFKKIQRFAAMLSCLSMMVPTAGLAAAPANLATDSLATDIALQQGGLLVGQVLDQQGAPQSGHGVALLQGNREVARTKTDENGVFAVAGMRGGQYQVVTDESSNSIRAWAPNTAPPTAREGSLIIVGDQVVRGNIADSPRWAIEWARQHPWLTTIGVVAAVAIPVAIAADDDDNS